MTNKTLSDVIDLLLGYVNPLIALLFGILIAVYLWKIVEAVAKADSGEKRKEEISAALSRIFLIFLGLSFFTIAQLIYRSIF